jgi:hypothetical protein
LFDELAVRNLGQDRPVICLMDGERSLWDAQGAYFPEAIGVLDLFHVLERIWGVAHCYHKEGSDEAEQYVEERLRDLLEGRVGSVIEEFRRRMTAGRLRGNKREVVKSAIEYLENNREHMRYDEYLAAGYPIGSGCSGGCVSPSGQGPDGTDGGAVDSRWGAGDAPRASVVRERPVGQAIPERCGIAESESRPNLPIVSVTTLRPRKRSGVSWRRGPVVGRPPRF